MKRPLDISSFILPFNLVVRVTQGSRSAAFLLPPWVRLRPCCLYPWIAFASLLTSVPAVLQRRLVALVVTDR